MIGLLWNSFVFWLLSNTFLLGVVRFSLMLLALGWAYLFVDAWRLGEPLALRQKQRLAMVGINGVLCFSVAGSLLFAAHVVAVQKDFIAAMFTSGKVTSAHGGRFNVLLLGGDSGKTRWGLRPDSLTVASVDEETGRTMLFGLPRNLQNFPFAKGSVMAEQFPHGYNCATCEINSLVTWADDHKPLFKGYPNPGIEATKEAVEGVTGLKINYYVMVNLKGFRDLVDAVGGVTLTVHDPIPKGGIGDFDGKSYIKPGTRKLNGARHAVVRALPDGRRRLLPDGPPEVRDERDAAPAEPEAGGAQVRAPSPGPARRMVKTDIPASELDRFMQLALKARGQPVRTVSFVPPMINTVPPGRRQDQGRPSPGCCRRPASHRPGSSSRPPPSRARRAAPRQHPRRLHGQPGQQPRRRLLTGPGRVARVPDAPRRTTDRPRIVAVAVTFNRLELVTRLVTETARGTVLPDEIVVVDNASTDGTVEALRALAARCR